jgi:Flp pilus assembly CpaF family ATPase
MNLAALPVLQPLLSSPDVVEIMIVNGTDVWVERKSGTHRELTVSRDDVVHLVEGICRLSGRRVDALSPILASVSTFENFPLERFPLHHLVRKQPVMKFDS